MSLKQSSKGSSGEPENVANDMAKCWHRERDRACLRVEMRTDEVFIFPYQQFLGAHHVRASACETVKITLSTHELTLTGHRLEKLLAALQEFALDWIRPFPMRYRDLGEGSEGIITSIDVRALGE